MVVTFVGKVVLPPHRRKDQPGTVRVLAIPRGGSDGASADTAPIVLTASE
jgi:hypothetical protein